MKRAGAAGRNRALHRAAGVAAAKEDWTLLMPETVSPIRSLLPFLALLVTLALAGCSGGDFGRTRNDMRNDDMHSWIGREATASIGVHPSQFQLTENERQ